jgi:hypothetical protein
MTYRHREGTVGPSAVGADGAFIMSAPDADLSAGTSVRLSSAMEMDGGVVARYLAGGYGIAPVLGARYDSDRRATSTCAALPRRGHRHGHGNGPPLVTVDERGEAFSARGLTVGFRNAAPASL